MIDDFLKGIDRLKKDGYSSIRGLVISAFLTTVTALFIISSIGATNYQTTFVCLTANIINLCVWFYQRRIPKSPNNKIGILFCIATETESESAFIRDFHIKFDATLKGSRLADLAFIHICQNAVSSSLIDRDLVRHKVHKKGYALALTGRVRKRKLKGKDTHIIDLDAYVTHRQLDSKLTKEFQSDISNHWFSRYNLEDVELDFNLTEISTDIISLTSKYVLASAAAISGSGELAIDLLSEIINYVDGLNSSLKHPKLKKIRENSRLKLNGLLMLKVSHFYDRGLSEGFGQFIDIMAESLEQVVGQTKGNYDYKFLRCIVLVCKDQDYNKALNILQSMPKKYQNEVWHCNVAFLYGATGDLKKCFVHYDNAATFTFKPATIEQVESFVMWHRDNLDSTGFEFLIAALLNHKIKGDLKLASEDYQMFLKVCGDCPEVIKKRVESRIQSIDKARTSNGRS